MALTTLEVQGSNQEVEKVLLDTITNQIYALPLYKLGLGIVGEDDGPVSTTNRMPVDNYIGGNVVSKGNPVPIGGTELHKIELLLERLSDQLGIVIEQLQSISGEDLENIDDKEQPY